MLRIGAEVIPSALEGAGSVAEYVSGAAAGGALESAGTVIEVAGAAGEVAGGILEGVFGVISAIFS